MAVDLDERNYNDKKLANTIVEAEVSQDQQLASLTSREAWSVALGRASGAGAGGRREKTQGPGQAPRQKQSCLLSLFAQFRSSADWVRPTHMGRPICSTQSTDANVSLFQKPSHTPPEWWLCLDTPGPSQVGVET